MTAGSAEHYTWPSAIGDRLCDGWHLYRFPGLSIIEERMPAEMRHLHRRASQFFYVLAGELWIERDGEEIRLSAGSGCAVAPRQPHQVFNRASQDVRFLVVSQPPSHGDRVTAEAGMRISTE